MSGMRVAGVAVVTALAMAAPASAATRTVSGNLSGYSRVVAFTP